MVVNKLEMAKGMGGEDSSLQLEVSSILQEASVSASLKYQAQGTGTAQAGKHIARLHLQQVELYPYHREPSGWRSWCGAEGGGEDPSLFPGLPYLTG
jgi:hypothetical protein